MIERVGGSALIIYILREEIYSSMYTEKANRKIIIAEAVHLGERMGIV